MSKTKPDEEQPDIGQRLLAAVDDPAQFSDPVLGEDEADREAKLAAHREQCRAAMSDLFDQAAYCWNIANGHDFTELDEPELLGPTLHEKHFVLSSCWVEDFRNAIRKAAETADAEDRDFLYFMLGTLELGGAIPAKRSDT